MIDPEIIFTILQALIPELKIKLADKIQFAEKINLADNITLNINIDSGDNPGAKAVVMPRGIKNTEKQVELKKEIVVFDSRAGDKAEFEPEVTAVSSGVHFIIDNPAFWDNKKGFTWKKVKVIPYTIGEKITISTMEEMQEREFELCVNEKGDIEMSIWKGSPYQAVKFFGLKKTNHNARDSFWRFEKCPPNKFVAVPELPEIIISFDKKIVNGYILINREHHRNRNEYYILVDAKI